MSHLDNINPDYRDSFSDLCDSIESNEVIPILGYDLFAASLLKNIPTLNIPNGLNDDLMAAVCFAYNEPLCGEMLKKHGEKIKSGYDLINVIYHSLPTSNKRSGFASAISRCIVEFRKQIDAVPESFEQLARIKPFRFYINATFFNSLELAVSTYKVAKAQKEKAKNYDVFSYNPREFELGIKYNNESGSFSTSNFRTPTIFNMLGRHDSPGFEYVITDVHFTELIVQLISNYKSTYTGLKTSLKGARLLFIGCDFPEWILRFFLRFCIDEKLDKERIAANLIEQLPSGTGKSFLLGNYQIQKFDMKPDIFIDTMYKELAARDRANNNSNNIETDFRNNLVFISYNHADKGVAQALNKHLNDNYVDCWFDENNLENGDLITEKIRRSVDDACKIMVIVSNNSNASPGATKYFKREWNYIMDNCPEKVCKIVMSDYNGHTLIDNIFTDKVKNNLLGDGDLLMMREVVSQDEIKLSAELISKLKREQYQKRMSETEA
jgi:TIR domain